MSDSDSRQKRPSSKLTLTLSEGDVRLLVRVLVVILLGAASALLLRHGVDPARLALP